MAWLIVDDRDGNATLQLQALAGTVPLAGRLPGPVLRSDADKVERAVELLGKRGVASAVLRSVTLDALRARRRPATTIRMRAPSLIIDTGSGLIRVAPGDLAAAFVVDDGADQALCLVRRASPDTITFRKSTLDASFLRSLPRSPDDAFAALCQGFARLLGRPVDESLRGQGQAQAAALGLGVLDLVDIAVAFARGELSGALLGGPPAIVPATVGVPIGEHETDVQLRRRCQFCDKGVDLRDCYLVLSQPTCDACADTYLNDQNERAAKLGGIFAASVVAFVALVLLLDHIGRAVGAVIVLFVFYTLLATGAQYDVDVERQTGKERKLVRAAGAFKKWGDLDNHWWGKLLVRPGLLLLLGLGAWFLPLRGLFTGEKAPEVAVVRDAGPLFPTHTLEASGAPASRSGVQVRLMEVEATAVARFVVELRQGEHRQLRTLSFAELSNGVDAYGVRFRAIASTVPPATPTLTIAFEADINAGHIDAGGR